jgi:hypothetical protein
MFKKATKAQARLRLALIGPSGSGKTYTALSIASALGGKVAVVDTERGSASKYAGLFPSFDTCELEHFDPREYVKAIKAAEAAGYSTLILDSLSHAWIGAGGALDLVGNAQKRGGGGNSFAAWRDVTPLHNALIDAILGSRCHIIATLRSKTEYVQEKDERGRTQIRKVGLQPVQRDGLEYEFDVVCDLDTDNNLLVGKTRCPALAGRVYNRAGAEVAEVLRGWLSDGAPQPAREQAPVFTAQAAEVLPAEPSKRSELEAAMRTATSQPALDTVAGKIKAALASGEITAEDRAALIVVYGACKAALARVVEAAPQREVGEEG